MVVLSISHRLVDYAEEVRFDYIVKFKNLPFSLSRSLSFSTCIPLARTTTEEVIQLVMRPQAIEGKVKAGHRGDQDTTENKRRGGGK